MRPRARSFALYEHLHRDLPHFDPAPSFGAIACPVLAILGEADEWTPVEPSVRAWRAALGARAHVEVLAHVDHALEDRDGALSPRYGEVLTEWLLSAVLA